MSLGYYTGNDLLIRGGFSSFPIQRVTTFLFYGILALCLFLQRNKLYDKAVALASAVGLSSLFLFVYNFNFNHRAGIESFILGSATDSNPSQLTLIIFVLHSIAFVLIATKALMKTKLFFHILALFSCGMAILGYITGIEFLYFSIEGFSYGVAVNTAVLGFVFGLACTAEIYKEIGRRKSLSQIGEAEEKIKSLL